MNTENNLEPEREMTGAAPTESGFLGPEDQPLNNSESSEVEFDPATRIAQELINASLADGEASTRVADRESALIESLQGMAEQAELIHRAANATSPDAADEAIRYFRDMLSVPEQYLLDRAQYIFRIFDTAPDAFYRAKGFLDSLDRTTHTAGQRISEVQEATRLSDEPKRVLAESISRVTDSIDLDHTEDSSTENGSEDNSSEGVPNNKTENEFTLALMDNIKTGDFQDLQDLIKQATYISSKVDANVLGKIREQMHSVCSALEYNDQSNVRRQVLELQSMLGYHIGRGIEDLPEFFQMAYRIAQKTEGIANNHIRDITQDRDTRRDSIEERSSMVGGLLTQIDAGNQQSGATADGESSG